MAENRVGDHKPSPERMQELRQRLEEIVNELRSFGVTLSEQERVRVTRPRVGGEVHVPRVLELAKQYNLHVPDYPAEAIQNDLSLAAGLVPFRELFRTALGLVDDTINQAESEYWEGFLAYYGVLDALSYRTPQLQAELRPLVEFMALGRRRRRSGGVTTGEGETK